MKWYGWEDNEAIGRGQICECCFKKGQIYPPVDVEEVVEIDDPDPSRRCNVCGEQMQYEEKPS